MKNVLCEKLKLVLDVRFFLLRAGYKFSFFALIVSPITLISKLHCKYAFYVFFYLILSIFCINIYNDCIQTCDKTSGVCGYFSSK